MNRLDYYDILPAGMDAYLSHYGWHFSKAMFKWAVGRMRDRNGNKLVLKTRDQLDSILRLHGVELEHDEGYDALFVFHMGMSDYLGSSVVDEARLAKYVKDVLDDVDGYDGIAFTRFIADCNGKGVPVNWEDMM